MAIFRVGQRVRNVADSALPERPEYGPQVEVPIGTEGTVIHGLHVWRGPDRLFGLAPGKVFYVYAVRFDGCEPCVVEACEIVPLTDPGFDAFMERVKKPVPLDEPVSA